MLPLSEGGGGEMVMGMRMRMMLVRELVKWFAGAGLVIRGVVGRGGLMGLVSMGEMARHSSS
jgi:hypothetical protein